MCNGTIVVGGKEAIDGNRFTKFKSILDEYLEAQLIASAAKREADALKTQVDTWMAEHKHERVAVGKVRVDRITVTSNRFNASKFKSANPELHAQFVEPSESVRLSFHEER